MKEIWKDIKDYEGLYQVSNLGNVKSYCTCQKGKNMKLQIDKDGYLAVGLYRNKKYRRYKVHRLVALMFIPNKKNLPIINHKDENKQNNYVENLEWCTVKYNNNFNNRQIKIAKKREKAVIQMDINGKILHKYKSIREAEKYTRIANQSISKVLKGKRNVAGGYIWKYQEREDD